MITRTENRSGLHFVDDLLCKDEVYATIGAAFETHNVLGSGFTESVYQEAFEYELRSRNIPFASQPNLQVQYKELILTKTYKADLIAFDKIIIELKVIDNLSTIDDSQILNYLKAAGMQLGLLIKFGSAKLEWRRRVLSKKNIGEIG